MDWAVKMAYNGPAIWGGCVTRRQHPATVLVSRGSGATKLSRCKEGMAWFLPSGYKFCELYECRGTRLIGSRLQVKVTEVFCGYWRGRGISYYKSVKEVGAKAKTMTNNLPILSVLAVAFILEYQSS